MRRIGIDVGGTNTDAVLLEHDDVAAAIKTPTTPDVMSGITNALRQLLDTPDLEPSTLDAVMIGTTHFTNAVAQRRDVSKVAAIRICLPASASLEPFIDWPADLADKVCGDIFMLHGGNELDGRILSEFDEEGMRAAARKIRDSGCSTMAITAVFSPITNDVEERAAQIMAEEAPEVAVTLSHRVGRLGLLERENATLLNASLKPLAKATTDAFIRAIDSSGIRAPLYLTQNDGTVMLAEIAEQYPVFCVASGPTNSMRGGAFLSQLSDAMVVDVGGTTTDFGMLKKGFPREANNVVEVGGVRTLFRMPDLLSIALGGGTVIRRDPLRVGPDSTGYELLQRGLVFGGGELTATDVAVAAGRIELGQREHVGGLAPEFIETAMARMREMISVAVERMKIEAGDVPLLALGGGAFLVPEQLPGVSEVIHVEHAAVANAVGAAIAQISGECDQIFQGMTRDQAIAKATRIAEDRAVEFGAARKSLETVDVEDLPLAYMPGDSLRIRVRVVGDVAD